MHASLQRFKRTEAGLIHLLCFERPGSQLGLNLKERLLTEGEKCSKTNGVTVTNSFVLLLCNFYFTNLCLFSASEESVAFPPKRQREKGKRERVCVCM